MKGIKQFTFLLHHKLHLLAVLLVGIGVSLTEGLGIALVFPLIQGADASEKTPFPFNHMLEMFSGMNTAKRLEVVAILLVCITAARGIGMYLKNILGVRLQQIIGKHFQVACFQQLMNVGMEYFNKQRKGALQTIIDIHTKNIGASMSRFAKNIHMPFTILIMLIILVFLSWKVTLVTIVLAFILIIVIQGFMRKMDHISRRLSIVLKDLGSTLFDSITGTKVIRLFNRQKSAENKYEHAVDDYNQTIYNIEKLRGTVEPFTQFAGSVIVAIIIILASFLIVDTDNAGISVMLVFLVAFNRIMGPIVMINQIRVSFIGDLPYYREVFDFLDSQDKRKLKTGTRQFTDLQNAIEFQNITFNYNTRDQVVLKDMSFYLKKGEKIGVVGPSGAGKSTITELLLRFYDPQQGSILIDGIDLRTLQLESWRHHIGVVSQDVFLFNDTIRNNIAFAKPDASMKEIETAARQAHAYEFIKELTLGYDTILGDRGVLLSGGQRQRIAIARAIIINPEILVFDEATSSLDTESEKIVQKTLDEIGQGRTVITIAHRLSTIFDSDKIIVLDAGRIIEKGTHAELIARHGLYHKLVQMQKLDKQLHHQNV